MNYMQEKLGIAEIHPKHPIIAGSYATFDLIYTAGYFGIDDSGSLKIVQRFPSDMATPQFDAPSAENYISLEVHGNAQVRCSYQSNNNTRPWRKTLLITVFNGFLKEGDQIILHFGDKRGGSQGIRMQTFCEKTYELKVLVDAFATRQYVELSINPELSVIPGTPENWVALLPTIRRCNQHFRLAIKAEDKWGNPCNTLDETLYLQANCYVHGLPRTLSFSPGDYAKVIEGLSVSTEEMLFINLIDSDGQLLATSNPLQIVAEADLLPYWGDLHGQSEETIGTNSIEEYFDFGRNKACLDVMSIQGNDFQITQHFWDIIQTISQQYNEPGRFITLPGYEWSANTGLGGDHNVIFFREHEKIHRSSHALVPELTDGSTDCHHIDALFTTLSDSKVFFFAHAGGRYADLYVAKQYPSNIAIEIHSAWGTFPWLLLDAFELGLQVGIVANSDDHKGRPGASYPGASSFGSYGGLTCFLCSELTRNGIFESLSHRHHYATTGTRMLLDTRVCIDQKEVIMGDIIVTDQSQVNFNLHAVCSSPIERVEIFNGNTLATTFHPYTLESETRRIRVIWEGAEHRGRGRETVWDGQASLMENTFLRIRPINFWNPLHTCELKNPHHITWTSMTTGGFSGFDAWLSHPSTGTLVIQTPPTTTAIDLSDRDLHGTTIKAGGLSRQVKCYRLPEQMSVQKLNVEIPVRLKSKANNPLYVRLIQEDGHVGWTSPIYIQTSAR
jgi:hypothetical protein